MKSQTLNTFSRRISFANVITQSGIIVTGAVVRLTGSGLGCPTWPDCAPGSLFPVASQVEGFHKYIEFGNRLLTFVVLAVAILLFVAGWLSKNNQIRRWTFLPLIGTLIQAVLGGITVLTGLNPFTVMAHFLLSIILVAISVKIYAYYSPKLVTRKLSPVVSNFINLITVIGFLVIVLGTISTGAGPHSGDDIAARFDIDMRAITSLHANSVILFVGLIIGLVVLTRIDKKLDHLKINANYLLIICIVQGVLGYVQWFASLPWILVSFHVLGSVITWIAIVFLALNSNNRFLQRLK